MAGLLGLAPGREASCASRSAFLVVATLIFAAGLSVTVAHGVSMSGMGELPMPGGWTLSMMWMPVCGGTWSGTAASFLAMWGAMMVAMMLPSLAPVLWRYRLGAGERHPVLRTAVVGIAYFVVWTGVGMVVFPLGALLAEAALRLPALAHAMPVVGAAVVLAAGIAQFSGWKARHLADIRTAQGHAPAGIRTAWKDGLGLGVRCVLACAGPMAILLVVGVMDPVAMAAVTAAITIERLAPAGPRVARAIGAMAVAAGVFLLVRAVAIG